MSLRAVQREIEKELRRRGYDQTIRADGITVSFGVPMAEYEEVVVRSINKVHRRRMMLFKATVPIVVLINTFNFGYDAYEVFVRNQPMGGLVMTATILIGTCIVGKMVWEKPIVQMKVRQ